jgi:hypothetical protein
MSLKGMPDPKEELLHALFGLMMQGKLDEERAAKAGLDIEFLKETVGSLIPPYDFEEPEFDAIWAEVKARDDDDA